MHGAEIHPRNVGQTKAEKRVVENRQTWSSGNGNVEALRVSRRQHQGIAPTLW